MRTFTKPLALVGALALATAITLPSAAFAQFPERQITFVIPYNAGGGLDFVARIIANGVEERTGQSIIVDSRPGAAGTIGAQSVLQAEPDGYTVLLAPAAPLVNVPLLRGDTVPYDAEADFVPITKLIVSPIMVLVNDDVEAQNLEELVELAQATPGSISIGNSGSGSTQQLLSLIFAQGIGAELNMISYTGSGEIVPDLLAGRLNMMLDFPAAYTGYVESGEVRMLATLSGERNPLFPDTPTLAELGLDVPAWSGWFSMFADADTPQEARDWLATEVQAFLNSDEAAEALAAGGYSPDPVGADAVNELMAGERIVLRKLIEEYDLKVK